MQDFIKIINDKSAQSYYSELLNFIINVKN